MTWSDCSAGTGEGALLSTALANSTHSNACGSSVSATSFSVRLYY